MEAVHSLGYTPDFGGRALASRRTNTVGAIIPTMENAIFARGLQSFQEALTKAGKTLLVASSGYDPAREREQMEALIGRGADGLLLIGSAGRIPASSICAAAACPIWGPGTLAGRMDISWASTMPPPPRN
jgi:LacI family transcriptional regulator